MMLRALLLFLPAVSYASPSFTHQGRLLDAAGAPINGNNDVTVRLFESVDAEEALWEQIYPDVVFEQGFFTVLLDGDDRLGTSLESVMVSDRFMDIQVANAAPFARQPIRSVPTSHRTEGVAHVDTRQPCSMAGGLGWDVARDGLFVCDGSAWSELGARRLPTLYRDGLPDPVDPPNSDASCGTTTNSPWVPLTGIEVAFEVDTATEIEVSVAGAIGDIGTYTAGLHCAVRYLVDGQVLPSADASWGHHMVSRDRWGWFGLGSDRRASVSAGPHTVTLEGRSGLCSPPSDYDRQLCRFERETAAAHGTYLHVRVP